MASKVYQAYQPPPLIIPAPQEMNVQKCPDDLHSLNSLQKHYICDGLDYLALKQIKKYLTTDIVAIILKYKDVLLMMGFSLEFINSLLSLGVGKNTVLESKTKDAMTSVDLPVWSELTDEEENMLASQCKRLKKDRLSLLECKLCTYQSKSAKIMVRHLGCHDTGKSFTCSKCSFNTPFRSKWNQHKCRMSAERRSLSCNTCSESFQTGAALDHHMVSQHNDLTKTIAAKTFACDKCPYVGKCQFSLVDHQRKHTGDYFHCTQPGCAFKTPYKRSLKKHVLQTHSSQNSKVCHICGIQVKHSSLTDHMRRHKESSKKYECPQCSFASHRSIDVDLHVKRKHLQEKKYACSKCSFQTGYPMVLKKHLARHEVTTDKSQRKRTRKEKEHCSFCAKIFKTKSERMKHEECCSKVLLPDTTQLQTDMSVVSSGLEGLDPKLCDVQMLDGQEMYNFDSELEKDLSEEVFNITSNMINHDRLEGSTDFTAIVDDSMGASLLTQNGYRVQVNSDPITTCKGRNPMLAETTRTLPSDRDDSPLLGDSLLSLMSDFPRPPPANRCQSATTLMFASLSPHLVDRPLTPDFLSDNPSTSFFL